MGFGFHPILLEPFVEIRFCRAVTLRDQSLPLIDTIHV
jgi:hypothetical protein